MWLNVTTWDKLAETVEQYAKKGMQVFVQGKLQIRSYIDKDKVTRQAIDIVAFTVQLLEKRHNGEEPLTSKPSDNDLALSNFPDE
jgi:single-strand DNA-binding protein